MTRINDVAKVLGRFIPPITDQCEDTIREAARALDAAGHLLPTLPEPDNAYPEWQVGDLSISPGIGPGEVCLEWVDREDTGGWPEPLSQALTPDQVRAIIAAHYHRKDQE